MIKVIQAKKIITMNPRNPIATHMSILNGRILQVGSIEKIAPVEKYELDDSFKAVSYTHLTLPTNSGV